MTQTTALDAPPSLSRHIENHRNIAADLESADLLRGNVPLLGIAGSASSPNDADKYMMNLGWPNSIAKVVRAAARIRGMKDRPEYWGDLAASVDRKNWQHALDRYRFGEAPAGIPPGVLVSTHQLVCGEEFPCNEPLLMREFQFPEVNPVTGRPLATYISVEDVYEFHSLGGRKKLNKDLLMQDAMRSPRFQGSYSHKDSSWNLWEGHSPKQTAERLDENFLVRMAEDRLSVKGGRIYVSDMPIQEYYKALTIVRKLDDLAEWQAFDRMRILVSDNLGPNYTQTIGWMKVERVIIVNDEASIPNYTPQQAMVVRAYFEIKPDWSVRLWREDGFAEKRPPAILHTHESRREKQQRSLDLTTATTMLAPIFAKLCALEGRAVDLASSLGSSFFTNPPENLVDLLV